MSTASRVFATDRRIRLGILGLGRGVNFAATCALLNIDIVAGCDFNPHMRAQFQSEHPHACVTDDADAFLAQDFDAVLLATFCPAHADDAIRCLQAGKHVLSEVTAFHTLAEGVRLVEAVEESGTVYQLAENYPFTPENRYLARKWREGLFGELMYAEYEYNHEIRSLSYTYIDNVPIQPGHTVHRWRSWLNYHYYCTHSLGPMMVITGLRPTRVVALPAAQQLAGYPTATGLGGVAPALINMSNGAVVRNLMGATTNDSHVQRIWGTRGAAELNVGAPLQLRLGGSGNAPKLAVRPSEDPLGALAAATGHGGGDFWVLYYFAREILTGEPGPFNIYAAADVTTPGILALRSSLANGQPFEVPDFRQPAERDRYRHDHWQQVRFDTEHGMFPPDADPDQTGQFTAMMAQLIHHSLRYRAYADWHRVVDDVVDREHVGRLREQIEADAPARQEVYARARALADAYPHSEAARVINEMLAIGEEEQVLAGR